MRRTRLHRKGIVSSVVVAMTGVLALALSAGAAGAVGTLDQSQEVQTGYIEFSSIQVDIAQTLTAGITGDLDQVDLPLALHPGAVDPPPLTIELQGVSGGTPSGVVLATAVVEPEDLEVYPDFPVIPISITIGPVAVTQGTQYAIVAKAGPEPAAAYVWAADNGDPYPGGAAMSRFPGQVAWGNGGFETLDASFRTYVTPAPPPPPPPPQQQCSIIRLSIGLGLGPPIVICL